MGGHLVEVGLEDAEVLAELADLLPVAVNLGAEREVMSDFGDGGRRYHVVPYGAPSPKQPG